MKTEGHTIWDEKTKHMMLYICERAALLPKFGAIHLNKTFWLADSLHYLKTRHPISNFKYIKQAMGPTPEPGQFFALRTAMFDSNSIRYDEFDYLGKVQKRYFANDECDLSLFTAAEIATIEKVLDSVKDMSATDLSQLTHQNLGWQMGQAKEEIPFYTYVLTMAEPSEADIEWGIKYANEHSTKSHH